MRLLTAVFLFAILPHSSLLVSLGGIMQMQKGAVNVAVIGHDIEITISCRCGRSLFVDTRNLSGFCQYCGTSFESQNIDLSAIIAEAKAEQNKQLEQRTKKSVLQERAYAYFRKIFLIPFTAASVIAIAIIGMPLLPAIFHVNLPDSLQAFSNSVDGWLKTGRNAGLLGFGWLIFWALGWTTIANLLKRRNFPELYKS